MEGLQGRKIALIGGAGFIGHNLAVALAEKGASVDVIDSLQVNNLLSFASDYKDSALRELNLKIINHRLDILRDSGITLHPVDARDYHALSRVLSQTRPQTIVHLAAIAHAGKSNKDPYSTFDHSLRTLENALDYSRGSHVEHFIYLSSSMVYGNFMTEEVVEDHPLNPIGIYGALKVAGEKIVIAYEQVFKLPFTIIRPSALYGPRCVSRRVGQIFIEMALQGKKLKIDGDGGEKLDFTFIEDLVEGISQVIVNPAARNQIFNLTYGSSRSIKDLAAITRQHFPGIDVEYVDRDHLMPFRGTLNVDKAKKMIGYAPKNPIDVGFPKYINWYKSLFNYKPKAAVNA